MQIPRLCVSNKESEQQMLDAGNKKWKDLAVGKIKLVTENLGLQMSLKSSSSKLNATSSPQDIDKAAAALYAFFLKYERVLQKEIAFISK